MVMPEASERVRDNRDPRPLRAIDRLSSIAAAGAGVALVALAVNVALDVAARTIGGRPLGLTLELTTYWWMPVLVTLAYAVTEHRREHITVTMLLDRLSPTTRRYVEGAFSAIGTVIVVLLTWHTSVDAIEAAEVRVAANSDPPLEYWPAKIIAAVGLALLALQMAATTVRHFWGRNTPAEDRPVKEEAP
jgi:TRAP-type C4-dicarboxylate transport system permease small subunit